MTLDGQCTGFEYELADAFDVEFDDGPPDLGGRDRVLAFITHSSMLDCAAATCAAAALAHGLQGLFFDTQKLCDGDEAMRQALANLKEVRRP